MGGPRSDREERQRRLSRRQFLRTAGGATAAAASAVAATATTGTEPASAQDGETHTVDMTDELVFDPDSLSIAVGDTVVWENVGTIPHSVTAYEDEIPEEAEYFASGGFDGETAAREAYPAEGAVGGGESYQHTFEVAGDYGYFCIPHEGVGMVASLTVGEAGGDGNGTPAGEEPADGGVVPGVPDSARALVVATTVGMASVLLFAYFFVKYGGAYGEGTTE